MTTNPHLLTDEDLFELTGYVRYAEQMRWLRENGLRPMPRNDGSPRITWEAVTAAMLTPAANQAPAPNYAALNRR